MRLALNLGYLAAWNEPAGHLALAQEAHRLGFSCVWVAEAYGSDAPSMLAWFAGQTERIELGSAVFQIPARTPAMAAMTAATIDKLSGGRFRLGLGVSGPQVSEGWHGVRFGKPLQRTREYIDIVNLALTRKTVAYDRDGLSATIGDCAATSDVRFVENGDDSDVGAASIERARDRATPALIDVLCRYPVAPAGQSRAARLMSALDAALRVRGCRP